MSLAPRKLFIAWQAPETRAIYPVARLVAHDRSPHFELSYIAGVHEAVGAGFVPFARMSRLGRRYFADDLRKFPLTANRLMPRSRPDFHDHVERLGLPGNAEPIQVLARSEGRRATDNLEFFAEPEYEDEPARWVYRSFIRGVRYVADAEAVVAELVAGDHLAIVRDKDNHWDPRALALANQAGCRVGWLPGALLDDLHVALERALRLHVVVEKVNLLPAPAQQRVLVRIEVPGHGALLPFSSDRFQPLACEPELALAAT